MAHVVSSGASVCVQYSSRGISWRITKSPMHTIPSSLNIRTTRTLPYGPLHCGGVSIDRVRMLMASAVHFSSQTSSFTLKATSAVPSRRSRWATTISLPPRKLPIIPRVFFVDGSNTTGEQTPDGWMSMARLLLIVFMQCILRPHWCTKRMRPQKCRRSAIANIRSRWRWFFCRIRLYERASRRRAFSQNPCIRTNLCAWYDAKHNRTCRIQQLWV
jgi:hypothetical protein